MDAHEKAIARTKGTAIIEIVKALRGIEDAAARLVPEKLQHYLTESLLPTKWYPEEDYKALLIILGTIIAPRIPGNVWEYFGEQGAARDLSGVYAGVADYYKSDPWTALLRMGRLWPLYRNTGRVEVIRLGPGKAQILLHDYAGSCPEVCGTTTGYIRHLLVLSGAKDVEVTLLNAPPPHLGPSEWSIKFRTE